MAFTYTTVNLAAPVSVLANQWVFIGVRLSGGSGNLLKNVIGAGPCSTSFIDSSVTTGTNPLIGQTFVTTGGETAGPGVVGGTFNAQGQSGGTVTVTQCYGNCGSPPITLANTNSTHTVNFNQSITLFYAFQSNLNGFVLNITTNLARTYPDSNRAPFLALYTIPQCPLGQTPFSAQCPGLQLLGAFTANFQKGRVSLNAGTGYPVFNGQWVGVAISAQMSGMDINDTNANVAMSQTSGIIPATISQSSQFSATSKIGLWAWIRGNIVTGAPPIAPPSNPCPGILDCVIPNLAFSLCFVPTPSCVSSSALLIAGAFAIASTFFSFKAGGNMMPNAKLPLGEIFLFWALVWILVFSGLSLLFVWVPIFFFLVISLMYGKHTGRYL